MTIAQQVDKLSLFHFSRYFRYQIKNGVINHNLRSLTKLMKRWSKVSFVYLLVIRGHTFNFVKILFYSFSKPYFCFCQCWQVRNSVNVLDCTYFADLTSIYPSYCLFTWTFRRYSCFWVKSKLTHRSSLIRRQFPFVFVFSWIHLPPQSIWFGSLLSKVTRYCSCISGRESVLVCEARAPLGG